MRKVAWLLFLFLAISASGRAQSEQPLLMQQPTLNQTHIVFVYGGYLWTVPRQGGDAVRLTSGPGDASGWY